MELVIGIECTNGEIGQNGNPTTMDGLSRHPYYRNNYHGNDLTLSLFRFNFQSFQSKRVHKASVANRNCTQDFTSHKMWSCKVYDISL